MSKEYKKNYISNFIIRLDLENKLNEGEYDKLISLLTKDFPINEKRDIQNRNIIIKAHDKNNPEAMLSDPELKTQVEDKIRNEKCNAAAALEEVAKDKLKLK